MLILKLITKLKVFLASKFIVIHCIEPNEIHALYTMCLP